ncbi:PREDICTED: putative uncharacterized protein FLJ46235 [Rhinopithecus bieti]|uniref:putative uncharacterized protein FLJ46235 n=1 Tax=Rhinopithecus bieti TaxID=61621 RepID=UPI00083C8772|nr:PREDICTED: putative uncharacterized protein FLJ46235 [Rhinopithecus bieti]
MEALQLHSHVDWVQSASRSPATASRPPFQAQLSLVLVPAGPAPASKQPLLTRLLPSSWQPCGLPRPSSCLMATFPSQAWLLPHSGLSRPSSCPPQQRLLDQGFLKSAPPGPAPASRRWPVQAQSILKLASPGPAPACRRPLEARPLPLPVDPAGPALASAWLPQAKLLPLGSLHGPSSCLLASPPGPELFSAGLSEPSSPSWLRSAGPAPASQ